MTNAPARSLASVLCLLLGACAPMAVKQGAYSAEQIRNDLEQFLDVVGSTHPDLAYSTNMEELRASAARIREGIHGPLTAREAWKALAELNAVFRDAHVGLQYPVAEFDAYRKAGGAVFPMAVYIDAYGALRAGAAADQVEMDEEIIAINDIEAAEFVRDASRLMRGETPGVQRLVLAYNFAAYFWTFHGPQSAYTVRLRSANGTVRSIALAGATEPSRPGIGSSPFRYEMLPGGVAYLDVRSFDISLEDDFQAFLDASFARIRSDRIKKLIIDLRRNPGGAHELSDALLRYLTDRRVRQASRLVARVTDDNRDIAPGAAVGDVVEVPWDEWLEPAENSFRFKGETFLLIGPRTYSQAIVFTTVVQDFGLGKVVGESTDGWANQTGQVKMTSLRHTGLLAAAPLYVILRPSGNRKAAGVEPDVPIAEDPADHRATIDKLLAKLTQKTSKGRP